ncbi:MAG: hypothetical protein GY846_01435, partial [Deltaproteobacteria bacterium]|nr:hypothetical protein [Deltaproteobacteria bacterium]
MKDTYLESGFGDLQAKGHLSRLTEADSGKKAELSLNLKNVALDRLPQLKQSGVSGKTGLNLEAMVTLPSDGTFSRGTLMLHTTPYDSAIVFQGKALIMDALHSLDVDAGWNDHHINLESLHMDTDFGSVAAKGEINIQKRSGRVMTIADLTDLQRFSEVLSPVITNLPEDLALSGAAKIDATVSGDFDSPVLACRVSGTDLRAMAFSAKEMTAQGEWRGPISGLDAKVSLKLAGFEGQGNQINVIDAEAIVKNESSTFTIAVDHEKGHQVDMSGKVRWGKDRPTEMAIEHLTLKTDRLGAFATLKNQGPIRLTWHQGTVQVASFRVASKQTKFDLSGHVATQGAKGLDLTITSDNLKLSDLPLPASNEISIEGILDLDLLVTGTLQAPEVS